MKRFASKTNQFILWMKQKNACCNIENVTSPRFPIPFFCPCLHLWLQLIIFCVSLKFFFCCCAAFAVVCCCCTFCQLFNRNSSCTLRRVYNCITSHLAMWPLFDCAADWRKAIFQCTFARLIATIFLLRFFLLGEKKTHPQFNYLIAFCANNRKKLHALYLIDICECECVCVWM